MICFSSAIGRIWIFFPTHLKAMNIQYSNFANTHRPTRRNRTSDLGAGQPVTPHIANTKIAYTNLLICLVLEVSQSAQRFSNRKWNDISHDICHNWNWSKWFTYSDWEWWVNNSNRIWTSKSSLGILHINQKKYFCARVK